MLTPEELAGISSEVVRNKLQALFNDAADLYDDANEAMVRCVRGKQSRRTQAMMRDNMAIKVICDDIKQMELEMIESEMEREAVERARRKASARRRMVEECEKVRE